MTKYIRVECIDTKTKRSVGGLFSALMGLLALKLELPLDSTEASLVEAAYTSDDEEIEDLLSTLVILSDLPKPEIYINDKDNHICLYDECEFWDIATLLIELNDLLEENTNGKRAICCKDFYLKPEEILYADGYQVVITKETYNKHKNKNPYDSMEDVIAALAVAELQRWERSGSFED